MVRDVMRYRQGQERKNGSGRVWYGAKVGEFGYTSVVAESIE